MPISHKMHFPTILLPVFLTLTAAQVNSRCSGSGGATGVCISTSTCSSGGGVSISGACPGTPADVRCCTKSSCGSGGSCQWTSSCASGNTLGGLCPGPSDFKCCLPGGSTGGGDLGTRILAKAREAEGTDYLFGGGSCNGATGGGFDCSGLLGWAICQVTGRDVFNEGLRNTATMYCSSESKLRYTKVAYSQRRAGDAVFFGGGCDCSSGAGNSGVHHVGIMMNSGTLMWNALKTGTRVRSDDFGSWGEKACPYVIRFS